MITFCEEKIWSQWRSYVHHIIRNDKVGYAQSKQYSHVKEQLQEHRQMKADRFLNGRSLSVFHIELEGRRDSHDMDRITQCQRMLDVLVIVTIHSLLQFDL
ncbi:hypothetical protein BsWGS_06800 [Bradybaena similaris]